MKRGLEFLAQLSELDIEWLLAIGVLEPLPRATPLIEKGQANADLILLIEGEARVYDPETGQDFAHIGKGELLGEISFIDKKGATAAVATLTPCRIFRMPRASLDEKLQRDPIFAGRFYKMIAGFLSRRLRQMVDPNGAEPVLTRDDTARETLANARIDRLLHRFQHRDVIVINGQDLTVEHVREIARHGTRVEVASAAEANIAAARELVDRLAGSERSIYGINTGLGALREIRIKPEDTERFQRNILLSHAVGIQPEYPREVARAIMVARLNGMARGGAGISPHVFRRMLDLLNADVVPVIPRRGSVGMSDLAPLAHMALPLIGEGEVWFGVERMPSAEALLRLGLEPVRLAAKDGVSLVSANSAAIGHGALVLARMNDLLINADIAAALSIEAFLANPSPLDERILSVRPHQGQVMSTLRLLSLLEGSSCHDPEMRRSLQDPISFRCIPQVHGPCLEAMAGARRVVELELNSTGDNPVVVHDFGDIVSNGNFHPAGVTVAFESLSNAISHLSSISTSRTLRLNNSTMTGLPSQLVANPGLNCGLGVLQKTVTMLNAQVRYLAAPASLDFMPVAASIEDHSTMATSVVSKLEDQIEACEQLLAIELLTAAQAVGLREGTTLGHGTNAAYTHLRQTVPFMMEDRNLSLEIAAVAKLVRDGSLRRAVLSVVHGERRWVGALERM